MRRVLLRWYGREARDLPWRRSQDPYAIWVSEAMLQQTRVATALLYYGRWMARFPTVASLAAAPLDDVLSVWSGLGYYARARNLHAAAQAVVAEHGGRLPRTSAELRELSGFGPYMAAAVASIAFGEPVAAVDGNVVRVLARLDGVRDAVDRPAVRRQIEACAQALVPKGQPGDWNQALMDLGATVCTPRRPRCEACPLAAACRAYAAGATAAIPRRLPKRASRIEHRRIALVAKGNRVLLVRNAARGLFGGMWVLPDAAPEEDLAAAVRLRTGVSVEVGEPAGRVRHDLTHRRLELEVVRARPVGGRLRGGSRWATPGDLRGMGLPTVVRKALTAAEKSAPSGRAIGNGKVRRL